ncbi:MAG TPA: alpha/beta hydrolase [Rhodospirillaceae bacterium]|nr:MAG: alpha/beta hydrolase [Alphaproteobacteria bacterium GWF2_58_20]HAU29866.1 alpha/beta hydrolase [Rhodospirillaceae bacterium]
MPDIIINGPAGRLECRYHAAKSPNAPLALLLHPHPQYGGTMNNRIIYTMFQTFAALGFSVLRFNFRGVGRSEGAFDKGEGELCDAAAALDWLQAMNPGTSGIWVGGFSFGAWIAMQLLMRRPEIYSFVAVAPPANMHDFSFLAPCPASGLIIQGEKDEVVPESYVSKLVQKLNSQRGISIDYRIISEASHFFTNQSELVSEHVANYVGRSLETQVG